MCAARPSSLAQPPVGRFWVSFLSTEPHSPLSLCDTPHQSPYFQPALCKWKRASALCSPLSHPTPQFPTVPDPIAPRAPLYSAIPSPHPHTPVPRSTFPTPLSTCIPQPTRVHALPSGETLPLTAGTSYSPALPRAPSPGNSPSPISGIPQGHSPPPTARPWPSTHILHPYYGTRAASWSLISPQFQARPRSSSPASASSTSLRFDPC